MLEEKEERRTSLVAYIQRTMGKVIMMMMMKSNVL